MKVSIEYITSAGIRAEMKRDAYTTAELLGTYTHPTREGNDSTVRLYRACDALVFETNGDPVWENMDGFEALAAEYGIDSIPSE